jgi:hypothetical protein
VKVHAEKLRKVRDFGFYRSSSSWQRLRDEPLPWKPACGELLHQFFPVIHRANAAAELLVAVAKALRINDLAA